MNADGRPPYQIGDDVYYATPEGPDSAEGHDTIVEIHPSQDDPTRLVYELEMAKLSEDETPEIITMDQDNVIELWEEDGAE